MEKYIFSLVMPTFNSEKTIRHTLNSIQKQSYDLSKLECLVIDGGSKDNTLKIAKEYSFVKIINNPKRLPEFAKQIGFKKALGKYIIKIDSDEAFTDNNTLKLREYALKLFPESHILVADKLRYCYDDKKEPCGTYLNACGDPFSYFIYRQKESILTTFKAYVYKTENSISLLKFPKKSKRPIADGGTTTLDLDYIKTEFGEEALDNIDFICSVSNRIMDKTSQCICIEDDIIDHRSSADFKKYLKKLKFRIINNIFNKKESGFSSSNISDGYKKYIFPIYTALFFPSFFDSIYLSIKYKDITMMLHTFYCYYTCFYIAVYSLMKLLKHTKQNEEY